MKKVMISQPMAGKTSDEIAEERKEMSKLLNERYPNDYEILDTTVPDYDKKTDLQCFSESISFMAQADILVMGIGWENTRGCILEHEIATAYNLDVLYLEELNLQTENKRYFYLNYDEEYYIFDNMFIPNDKVIDPEDFTDFSYSLTPEDIVEELNKSWLTCVFYMNQYNEERLK